MSTCAANEMSCRPGCTRPAFYRQIAVRNGDPAYTDTLEHRYAMIDLPVLVCWGEDDDWIPLDRGRELAARIPGARLHTLPAAGHLAPLDAPTALAMTLLGFLGDRALA